MHFTPALRYLQWPEKRLLTFRLSGAVAIVLPVLPDRSGSGRRCSALLRVVIADHTADRIHEYRVAFDIEPFPESIETSILRPQRWIGVPPLELGFEQLPVISPDPPFECGACICVPIAYQVNGSFFVRSLQSDRSVSVTWIRSVDPCDSRFLVSKYYCRTIDHCAFSQITMTKLGARRRMA